MWPGGSLVYVAWRVSSVCGLAGLWRGSHGSDRGGTVAFDPTHCRHSYGLYSYCLYSYGLYRYGLYRYGLYRYGYGLCSYGLLCHGLCRYGLYSYPYIGRDGRHRCLAYAYCMPRTCLARTQHGPSTCPVHMQSMAITHALGMVTARLTPV